MTKPTIEQLKELIELFQPTNTMSYTHIEDTKPIARKVYRCYVCGEKINIGEKHIARHGIEAGEGHRTDRFHIECELESQEWSFEEWESHLTGDITRAEIIEKQNNNETPKN